MTRLIQTIIHKHIFTGLKCCKLISKDGITTQELIIDRLQGLFEGIDINLKPQRIKFASVGRAAKHSKEFGRISIHYLL